MYASFSLQIHRFALFFVALSLCLILSALPVGRSGRAPGHPTTDEGIVIGVSVGLSGEGIAPLGIDIQRGVELGSG